MVIATKIGKSDSGLSWKYQVTISDLTADMIAYFTAKAARDKYCVFSEEHITWYTGFNAAKEIELIPHTNKKNQFTIIFRDKLSEEQEMAIAAENRRKFRKPFINKGAAEGVEVTDADNVTDVTDANL